jgi:hypothetical protein
MFLFGAVMPHLGCAFAARSSRGMALGPAFAICGGAVLIGGLLATFFLLSLGILTAGLLPIVGVSSILAVLAPLSITNPRVLRRVEPWISAAVAGGVGATVVILSIRMGFLGDAASLNSQVNTPAPTSTLARALAVELAGFVPLPGILAWTATRIRGGSRSETWRSAIQAYQPSLSSIVLVVLWLMAVRVTIGGIYVDFSALYIPAAIWVARRFGAAGLTLFYWGVAPLLLGLSFGRFGTRLDPGLFLASILIYRLVAEPELRARLPSLANLRFPELSVLILVGGSQLVLQPASRARRKRGFSAWRRHGPARGHGNAPSFRRRGARRWLCDRGHDLFLREVRRAAGLATNGLPAQSDFALSDV